MPSHKPSLVIHGGAGSISRETVPPASYAAYTASIRQILNTIYPLLSSGAINALDAATAAVKLLEDDPLFNAGKGAVFTLEGENELEASIMVSRPGAAGVGGEGGNGGKRGVGVGMLKTVRNPILFAQELLLREEEVRHNCLSGVYAEELAEEWGCEIVEPGYFWTEKRWKQHLDGLKRGKEEKKGMGSGGNRGSGSGKEEEEDEEREREYLPQGTVGCVAMDLKGVICVATSTGGLTNKLPGRIGDTPTLGAGFWAEEWEVDPVSTCPDPPSFDSLYPQVYHLERSTPSSASASASALSPLYKTLSWISPGCFSAPASSTTAPSRTINEEKHPLLPPPSSLSLKKQKRAVALSGTGNGDYFLRLAAAHSIVARCRFGNKSLQQAAEEMVGGGGEMQISAGEKWGQGDGEGGIIGLDEEGTVVMVMNCGGMFRGFIDEEGVARVGVFRDEVEK